MSDKDEQVAKLWREFNSAAVKVKRCLAMKGGGAAAEKEYAATFNELARAGEVQSLRSKYR